MMRMSGTADCRRPIAGLSGIAALAHEPDWQAAPAGNRGEIRDLLRRAYKRMRTETRSFALDEPSTDVIIGAPGRRHGGGRQFMRQQANQVIAASLEEKAWPKLMCRSDS